MSEQKHLSGNLPSAQSQSHEKLERPTVPEPEATLDPSTLSRSGSCRSSAGPKSIGPYRLLKKLGEGGMGFVWLAEQTAPVRRYVALKLIRAGLYDDSLLQRFQSEQQSLAVMNHPAIAKVFDAGSTPDGQPYFVMEHVDGPSITRYCDARKLKIRDRLEIFIKVCEGVQHAHQKAIIHRDLKPSNVLIAEVDGKPVPRIIDFGIAKAISSQASAEQTMFTQAGALVGTPGFMSPEQAASLHDVDTRTDVYSLGVILYVLLTGCLPFDPEQWRDRPLDEILRQLREDDTPRPSTKVVTGEPSATSTAENRRTKPEQLVQSIRGDLDWITLKALEKDRSRRYGTPSELAADIQRYLNNEPVLARPASASYRLRKYARRHWAGVASVGVLMLLLAGFGVMQAVQLRRITRERDRANHVTDFMIRMFKVAQPSETRGNTVTAREILDKASSEIDTGLARDPDLQAHMMDVMGNVYTSLGLYKRGEALLTRAVETRKGTLGLKNVDTLKSMTALAWNLQRQSRYAEAERLGRETLYLLQHVLGPGKADTLRSASDLSWTLYEEGKYAESEKLLRETLAVQQRLFGGENPETLQTMNDLGWTLGEEGKYAEGEKLERETLEIRQRLLGVEHPDTQTSMNNLAGIFEWEGRYADADKLYRELIEVDVRVRGREHPDTLLSMNNLANVLGYEGRYAEAVKMQEEVLDTQRRVLGPENRDTLITAMGLAISLGGLGRYDEAERLLVETRDIQRRVLGPQNPRTADTTYNMACLAVRRGRRDEAISLLREAMANGLSPAQAIGMATDPDLKPLHEDAGFASLVEDAKRYAGAAGKEP